MKGENKNYCLGTGNEELVRLGYQHRIWAVECSRFWRKLGFSFGHKVLDLGCGPGFISTELAQMVGPSGSVTSVDGSEKYIQYFNEQLERSAIKNVTTRQGDLHEMDFPSSSFDGIYARFVFIFLSDLRKVISDCYKFLKKGGVFGTTEFASYSSSHFLLSPRSKIFEKVIDAIRKNFDMNKGNLDVQLELPQIMAECGFEIRDIDPVVRVARPKDLLWHWPSTFFKNHIPKLIELKLLEPSDEQKFWKDWEERSRDPKAFFITPPILNITGVKP